MIALAKGGTILAGEPAIGTVAGRSGVTDNQYRGKIAIKFINKAHVVVYLGLLACLTRRKRRTRSYVLRKLV